MKTMLVSFFALSAHFSTSSSSAGDISQWNITAECQIIVIPQKLAFPLLPDLNEDVKIESAFAKLQPLIAKGSARLEASLIARSNREKRVTSESLEEFSYATELDPPSIPWHAPANPKVVDAVPILGITPTGFQRRELGHKLELSGSARLGGKIIDLDVIVTHTRFLRWQKTDAGALPNGKLLWIAEPIFDTIQTTSKAMLSNGQRTLIGVHKLTEPAGSLELILLKARAAPPP